MKASRVAGLFLALLWVGALVGLGYWSLRFEFATYPAARRSSDLDWPAKSGLKPAAERQTLLLFLHPHCPCSRASIAELEKVLQGRLLTPGQQPRVIVVAAIPPGASREWLSTDTIASASRLPHASLRWDVDGREASLFGAVVSGTVMLYGPDGMRRFAGGVTVSRGQEGDNIGSANLLAAFESPEPSLKTPVPAFGCRLYVAEEAASRGPANSRASAVAKRAIRGNTGLLERTP